METPNVEKLRGIGQWDPRVNDETNRALGEIKNELDIVADLTTSVATNLGLGLKGATADAAMADLDELSKNVKNNSAGLETLIKVRGRVLDAGRKAQAKNIELQKSLVDANEAYANALATGMGTGTARLEAALERNQAYKELEQQATTVLTTLREEAEAAIGELPFRESKPVQRLRRKGEHSSGDDDHNRGGDNGRSRRGDDANRSRDTGWRRGESGGGESGGDSSTLPPAPKRSVTEWSASSVDTSIDRVGGHASSASMSNGGEVGNLSLQASHYTPHHGAGSDAGATVRPSILHSPAVHNTVATAAAMAGGAAVAGYKAYQAVRSGASASPVSLRAANQSGAATRVPATGTRSSGIVRGATTAVRKTSSMPAQNVSARGGASGIARRVDAAPARGSGIVKGATTASRAAAPASPRNGIVKGATTAVRARTSASPAGAAGGSSSARPGMGTSGSASVKTGARASGGNVARGSTKGVSAKGVNSRGKGLGALGRVGGAREATAGQGAAGTRSVTSRATTGSLSANARPASAGSQQGVSARTGTEMAARGRATAQPGMGTARAGTSATNTRGAVQGLSGRTPTGAASKAETLKAVAGLTGGRGRDSRKDESLSQPVEETRVSEYEHERVITFLEAGHVEETKEREN